MTNGESFRGQNLNYRDQTVRGFFMAMSLWAVVSAVGAAVLAILLVVPKLFYDMGDSAQHLGFGRLYPAVIQSLIYGFLGNGFFAFLYYVVQRSSHRPLALAPLASLHLILWQILIVLLLFASYDLQTQSRVFGWMPWTYDLALAAIWWLLLTPVIAVTLAKRPGGSRISPPMWFSLAVLLAVPFLQLVNGVTTDLAPDQAGAWFVGVQDMMVQWWTSRGMLSYWLTVPALAVLYYLVPRLSGGYLYSYRITVLHLWCIAWLGCWGGNFQWHLTAIPEWMGSVGMFAGAILWLGCLAGAYNLWKSLPGGPRASRPVALRLVTAAVIFYGAYCVDALFMSFNGTVANTQFTDWSTANLLLAGLGVSGLSYVALLLTVMPSVFGQAENPARGGGLRWLLIEGVAIQVLALYVAGKLQAFSWNDLNDLGRLEYPEFEIALGWVRPLWIIAAAGALIWAVATVMLLFMTLAAVANAGQPARVVAGGVEGDASEPSFKPSGLQGAPVLGFAVGFENWSQLAWHSALERQQGRLVRRLSMAILVGAALFWIPALWFRGSDATAASLAPGDVQGPYTTLEKMGREIYLREGCSSCHTQASRPFVAEVLRYGDFSRTGDYANDQPTQVGFRRVGPDLATEGGKRTSLWHWKHLENPQSEVPKSVMPSFDHLHSQPLDLGDDVSAQLQAQSIAADIIGEGGPVLYGERLVLQSRAIALIAYLQRLGVPAPVAPVEPVAAINPDES